MVKKQSIGKVSLKSNISSSSDEDNKSEPPPSLKKKITPQSLKAMRQQFAKQLNARPHSTQVTVKMNQRLRELQRLQSRLVKLMNQGPVP